MLTFSKFSGINNVLPTEQLVPDANSGITPLTAALNVDIGLKGELRRRAGYSQASALCHKYLHQADGFMLSVAVADLVATSATGTRTVIYPSLGPGRVWYCNLPDGRTTFSNGLINGITDGLTATTWGVPVPPSIGALTPVAGELFPGDYQYQITYVRLSDGLEGGPAYSNPIAVPEGGVLITGLPVLDGHSINIYLTAQNGDVGFLAGNTQNGVFSYLGKNDALALPCRTEHLQPAPAGTVTALSSGRVLVAVGSVLYASKVHAWEVFDFRRDFKQFTSPITLIQPVDGGVYIGTETELAFLSGSEFDKLAYSQVISAGVVLGSGVAMRGELINRGDGPGQGEAMICIADRVLVAGFGGGSIARMTEGRYATAVTEVAATFRMNNGVPQYLAVPQ